MERSVATETVRQTLLYGNTLNYFCVDCKNSLTVNGISSILRKNSLSLLGGIPKTMGKIWVIRAYCQKINMKGLVELVLRLADSLLDQARGGIGGA